MTCSEHPACETREEAGVRRCGYRSSIAITLDTYNHVTPGLGDVVASAMEDALGQ